MTLADWPKRKEGFICTVCHLPGIGAPGCTSHPGECRKEALRRNTRRWTAKRSRERKAKGAAA